MNDIEVIKELETLVNRKIKRVDRLILPLSWEYRLYNLDYHFDQINYCPTYVLNEQNQVTAISLYGR
jgi:hypothetical protein